MVGQYDGPATARLSCDPVPDEKGRLALAGGGVDDEKRIENSDQLRVRR
jgi:hypothetical protein